MAGLLTKIFGRGRADEGRADGRPEEVAQLLICPSCGDEYRAGFHSCAACGCELVGTTGGSSGAGGTRQEERGGELVEITAGEEVLTIRQAPLAEGKRLRRLLGRHGIAALLVGGGPPTGGGCCPTASIQLQIRPRDSAAAQRLLQEDYRRLTGLTEPQAAHTPDPDETEQGDVVRCAACGHPLAAEQQECPDCGLCCIPPE